MRDRLPQFVVALLERCVHDPIARAGLLGDLEERYAALSPTNRVRRLLWLTSEVSGVLVHYIRSRDTRLLDGLRQDVSLSLRGVVRRPGFSGLVIATLALGIGANTAVFSVVHGLLFEPLPYPESERLVLINQRTPEGFTASVSLPNYRDWKERSHSFDGFSAILPSSAPLNRPAGARVIETGWVHGGFFETLGVEAAVGRFFTAAESEPGAAPLVVLSNTLWLNEFGGDPDVVGGTIQLRGEPWTVVGVMPNDFVPYEGVLAYLPMGFVAERIAWDDRGTGSGTEIFARLAAGVTPEQAREELETIGSQIELQVGEEVGVGNLTTLRSWYIGAAGRQATLLMAAVALVLLVACVNVASLLFVRAERRRGEIAVRSALGASRARVYRQLLTESLVLSLLGGVASVGVGAVGLEALLTLSGPALPSGFAERIGIDGRILLFTGGLSLITAVLAGFLPAVRSIRTSLADTLRDIGRSTEGRVRAPRLLIGVEVALSMVLLVGAGLFMTSLARLQNADTGFDGTDVVTLRIQLSRDRYPDRNLWAGFHRTLREEISALPGVSSVATSNHFPLSGNSWEMLYRDEGTPPDDRGESVLLTMVSPEFFETFSVEIVRGRSFDDTDRWGQEGVAIVDETLAATRWPGENPLGKQISFEEMQVSQGDAAPVWRTVVGVARHVRHYELASPSRIEVYSPLDQSVAWGFTSYLSVRADTDLAALVPQIRRAVGGLDAEAPLYRIRTFEEVLDQQLGGQRALRGLLLAFALLTLLLGCVGIYSVVSHVTAVRVREIGLRMALGGSPSGMIRLVVTDSMPAVLVGVMVGGLGAAALGRVIGSLLYEVEPADPVILLAAGTTMTLVALLSAWIPARAAASVSPQSALSAD